MAIPWTNLSLPETLPPCRFNRCLPSFINLYPGKALTLARILPIKNINIQVKA